MQDYHFNKTGRYFNPSEHSGYYVYHLLQDERTTYIPDTARLLVPYTY